MVTKINIERAVATVFNSSLFKNQEGASYRACDMSEPQWSDNVGLPVGLKITSQNFVIFQCAKWFHVVHGNALPFDKLPVIGDNICAL